MMSTYYLYVSKTWGNNCGSSNKSYVARNDTDSTANHDKSTKTAIEIQEYISNLQSYVFQHIRNNSMSFNVATTSTLMPSGSNPLYAGKPLCQLVADLNNLIDTFNSVVGSYDMNNSSIYAKYNANNDLRNDLQKNIDMVYGKEMNSKLYLDSTVYTSVLWTILATTIIFYIFKKL